MNRTKLEGLAAMFLARAAKISGRVIALVSVLLTLGVETTSLIVALGGVGLSMAPSAKEIPSK